MTEINRRHTPVLSQDVIRYLAVREGGAYLDCTLGLAGHASQIARLLGPTGHLIGFDRDPKALELAGQRLAALAEELGDKMPKLTLIGEAFSKVAEHVAPGSLDGLLADFGVSSMQLDEPERGFSFQADGPLDMRQDTRQSLTAAQVVNEMDERDLANLIYEYGEERRSRRIARAIVRARPVTTTGQLARIVAGSAPAMKSERIHPATRTFQALRIHVNRELDEIRQLLEAAPKLLKPSGRLVVISFHSLEDRIAKDVLREQAAKGIWEVMTRKPVVAGEAETDRNPRSRSAKLRAAEMLGGTQRKEKPEYQDQGSGRMLTGFAQLAPKKFEKKTKEQSSRKKPRLRK
jgi:16S rRNA (cytosine1402-N4)-methyltransferase